MIISGCSRPLSVIEEEKLLKSIILPNGKSVRTGIYADKLAWVYYEHKTKYPAQQILDIIEKTMKRGGYTKTGYQKGFEQFENKWTSSIHQNPYDNCTGTRIHSYRAAWSSGRFGNKLVLNMEYYSAVACPISYDEIPPSNDNLMVNIQLMPSTYDVGKENKKMREKGAHYKPLTGEEGLLYSWRLPNCKDMIFGKIDVLDSISFNVQSDYPASDILAHYNSIARAAGFRDFINKNSWEGKRDWNAHAIYESKKRVTWEHRQMAIWMNTAQKRQLRLILTYRSKGISADEEKLDFPRNRTLFVTLEFEPLRYGRYGSEP